MTEAHCNSQSWDKELFNSTYHLTALKVKKADTNKFLKLIKNKYSFQLKGMDVTNIFNEGKLHNVLLLSVDITNDLSGLPDHILAEIVTSDVEVIEYDYVVGFDNYRFETALKKLFPDETEITSRFETVGHIAHMNLKEHLWDKKYIIGEILLEKYKERGIRTVVNKVGKIVDTFRVLPFELIAGEDDTIVELKESGCTFQFDFKDVFWNSRLENEHMRLVSLCAKVDIVCDVFAGVGPFAIPLARKCIQVYANDLNTNCFDALNHNSTLNLVEKKRQYLVPFNLDGREFIKHVFSGNFIGKGPITQVFMNLPKTGYQFLDAFIGIIPISIPLPTVHCYSFVNCDTDHEVVAVKQIEEVLNSPIEVIHLEKVRQTATKTIEFCVSFTLPETAYQKP